MNGWDIVGWVTLVIVLLPFAILGAGALGYIYFAIIRGAIDLVRDIRVKARYRREPRTRK